MGSQRLAMLRADKHGIGTAPPQGVPLRAIADHDQACIGPALSNGVKGVERHTQVLFQREASDGQNDRRVAARAPFGAQCIAAMMRRELARIHAACADAQALEAKLAELFAQFARGDEGAVGAVMKLSLIHI